MSSVSTRSSDPPRWWPLKSQSSSSSLKQSSGTLNALASAIGFRSKKSPNLTIQHPQFSVHPIITSPLTPSAESPSRPRTSPATATRPPSKSVSSTRSRGDSIGPKTPVDAPLHRQSLLTLSDINDPFAARAITVHHDPNRLSAYSNSSAPDYMSRKSDFIIGRDSFASSSSHSNSNAGELSPLSSPGSVDTPPPLSPNKIRKQHVDVDASWQSFNLVKTGSSSTLTDQNRLSQPHPPPKPRPPMRARGMTDGGSGLHPRFFRNEPPLPISTPSSPKTPLSRHPSSRVPGPTTAPPSQELPRPPNDAEASPASILFASALHPGRDPVVNYIPEAKVTADLALLSLNDTNVSLHAPRSLKKAVSQQSLTKNVVQSTIPSAPTSPSEPVADRTIRKQRSFHHPRIPLPSIPIPFHASSPPQVPSDVPAPESRRSSTNVPPPPTRKRLFSSSSVRRSSTSHHTHIEDDARSIFSLRSDSHGKNINSSTSNVAVMSHPSFWDESSVNTPSSPEWQPQQIMSPADMARLEARMDEEQTEQIQRRRGMSILSSTSTSISERDFCLSSGGRIPTRTSSLLATLPTDSMQAAAATSSASTLVHPPQTESGFISLAPPPRSWQRPSTSSSDHHANGFQPLSPPPRKVRKKASAERAVLLEKSLRRRSIMRKPSFLDIGDKDTDTEEDVVGKGSHRLEGSFLDLARESFDTIRSSEE